MFMKHKSRHFKKVQSQRKNTIRIFLIYSVSHWFRLNNTIHLGFPRLLPLRESEYDGKQTAEKTRPNKKAEKSSQLVFKKLCFNIFRIETVKRVKTHYFFLCLRLN